MNIEKKEVGRLTKISKQRLEKVPLSKLHMNTLALALVALTIAPGALVAAHGLCSHGTKRADAKVAGE
jgi:hypothetical protein